MTDNQSGPHIAVAAICESVIEDKEGVLSLIRLVDRIVQTATGPEPPEDMPPFLLDNVKLVIALKADQAKGRFAIKVRPEDPSGIQLPALETPVRLAPGGAGANVILDLTIPITIEGLYWFDILFKVSKDEDRLLSRVPLVVEYQPQRTLAQ